MVSYRGISGLYNSQMVDGANNNQALFSEGRARATSGAYVFSMDSMLEYQVSTSNYSAELGQAMFPVFRISWLAYRNAMPTEITHYSNQLGTLGTELKGKELRSCSPLTRGTDAEHWEQPLKVPLSGRHVPPAGDLCSGSIVSDNPTYPANLCPIWCGGTVSLSKDAQLILHNEYEGRERFFAKLGRPLPEPAE